MSSAPESLLTFDTVLYNGHNTGTIRPTEQTKRRAKSSCGDAIFFSNGSVKALKQVVLGMAVKSITGSKQLTQFLNRLGHSLNYNGLRDSYSRQYTKERSDLPSGNVQIYFNGFLF